MLNITIKIYFLTNVFKLWWFISYSKGSLIVCNVTWNRKEKYHWIWIYQYQRFNKNNQNGHGAIILCSIHCHYEYVIFVFSAIYHFWRSVCRNCEICFFLQIVDIKTVFIESNIIIQYEWNFVDFIESWWS